MEGLNQIAEQLLLAVKMQNPYSDLLLLLKNYSLDSLQKELNTDETKKAFWINCYNAYFQILRKDHQLVKPEIYRNQVIEIAKQKFSLDDMEHGILRKFRYKYSLGYLANPFVKKMIKKLAVSEIDFRIHFALNCGAESCPPIRFYTVHQLEEQLDLASLSFLESETDYLEEKKEIQVSQLFKWFLADFGGRKGIKTVLNQYLKLETKGFKISFKDYSWKEELDNFAA